MDWVRYIKDVTAQGWVRYIKAVTAQGWVCNIKDVTAHSIKSRRLIHCGLESKYRT